MELELSAEQRGSWEVLWGNAAEKNSHFHLGVVFTPITERLELEPKKYSFISHLTLNPFLLPGLSES